MAARSKSEQNLVHGVHLSFIFTWN